MRLAMAQMRMSASIVENLKKTLDFMEQAKARGAELIFFPELLVKFVRILGIESNMNGLYVLCIAFIIAILMTLKFK